MTDPRIASLVEALPDAANAAIAADAAGYWERFAAAILAALDGWTLIRDDFLLTEERAASVLEENEAMKAEIARLRAALDGLVAAVEGPHASPYHRSMQPSCRTGAALAAAKETP